jgi:hypothetical protein
MRLPPFLVGLVAAFVAAGTLGCERIAGLSNPVGPDEGIDADSDIDADPGLPDANMACNGTLLDPPNEGTKHVNDFDAVAWDANPPTSGTHYNSWAHWFVSYEEIIPRGFLVHNLEHAGIVLAHNCTDCDDELSVLVDIMHSMPEDPTCTDDEVFSRVLVTPDPDLPSGVRFAATAWNHSYTADCVDRGEIEAFIAAHYNSSEAPEPEQCADGSFPLK